MRVSWELTREVFGISSLDHFGGINKVESNAVMSEFKFGLKVEFMNVGTYPTTYPTYPTYPSDHEPYCAAVGAYLDAHVIDAHEEGRCSTYGITATRL